MPNTYTLIASNTVGSGGAASVTFSSISATYTDLLLKSSTRQSSGSVAYGTLEFNGSSANFTYRSIEGDGATAGSFNGATAPFGVVTPSGYTANTFSNIEFYIPNYASSNYKSYSSDSVTENNATASYADLVAGLWSNTAAITSIKMTPGAGNFVQYSTFYLYGISKS
jgi:hypothetical protein